MTADRAMQAALFALSSMVTTHKRTRASDRRCAKRMERAFERLTSMTGRPVVTPSGYVDDPTMVLDAIMWLGRSCALCGRCAEEHRITLPAPLLARLQWDSDQPPEPSLPTSPQSSEPDATKPA